MIQFGKRGMNDYGTFDWNVYGKRGFIDIPNVSMKGFGRF